MNNYYKTLNILPFVTNEEIKNSYEKIIKNYEKDDLTEDELREKLDIQKAYITLSDYHSRTVYDDQLQGNNDNVDPRQMGISNSSSNPQNMYDDDSGVLALTNSMNSTNIENMMLQIITRLDEIQQEIKEIKDNNINFYKEKKIVNNIIKKNGQKTSTTIIITNENGEITKTKKFELYNSKGNLIKTYYGDNIKKKI
jgi:DnaJ-class molecular chaperone